jgi:hypothetical protein
LHVLVGGENARLCGERLDLRLEKPGLVPPRRVGIRTPARAHVAQAIDDRLTSVEQVSRTGVSRTVPSVRREIRGDRIGGKERPCLLVARTRSRGIGLLKSIQPKLKRPPSLYGFVPQTHCGKRRPTLRCCSKERGRASPCGLLRPRLVGAEPVDDERPLPVRLGPRRPSTTRNSKKMAEMDGSRTHPGPYRP